MTLYTEYCNINTVQETIAKAMLYSLT